jgi:radical SAM protein with 4Fe4S-binding SPASM domain
VHCRALAQDAPSSRELSLSEIGKVLGQVAARACPLLILSGGEPLLREDILEVVALARGDDLSVVLATNGTLLTADRARALREAGVRRVSISLDGAQASTHDAFRQAPGAFAGALAGARAAREAGLPFQINMTLTAATTGELPEMVALCRRLGAAALHLFILVPTGRARLLPVPALSPTQYEELLERVCDLAGGSASRPRSGRPLLAPGSESQPRAKSSVFTEAGKPGEAGPDGLDIRVTCGPQFARVARQRAPDLLRPARGSGPGVTGCLAGVNFCFIGAEGTVQPCGYFQVDCGNVRLQDFGDIWRNSPALQLIRRRETFTGKCGQCEYLRVCGGCRARAYEATGDPLAADPLCAYLPRSLVERPQLH